MLRPSLATILLVGSLSTTFSVSFMVRFTLNSSLPGGIGLGLLNPILRCVRPDTTVDLSDGHTA